MTSGTDVSYESYMTVYVCRIIDSYDLLLESRRRQALRPAAESRLKCSGTQSLDCKGVYCASASLNASVPLDSRHGVAGPASTPVDAGGNSSH